jgi:hypothetical protein
VLLLDRHVAHFMRTERLVVACHRRLFSTVTRPMFWNMLSSSSELSYGQVFVVTEVQSRFLHYVVERLAVEPREPSDRPWLDLRPGGLVTVRSAAADGVQELRHSGAQGGPSWLVCPDGMTGARGRPTVYTVNSTGLPAGLLHAFEQLGFREGEPVGFDFRLSDSGAYEAYRSEDLED